jgi:hypothetical protein
MPSGKGNVAWTQLRSIHDRPLCGWREPHIGIRLAKTGTVEQQHSNHVRLEEGGRINNTRVSRARRRTLPAPEKTGKAPAAHEPARPSQWTEPAICQALRELHRSGRPIWSRKLRETNRPLHSAAIYWFGSYRKAIDAAGLDYAGIRQSTPGRWDRESVKRELRKLHRQKVPLHHASIERQRPDLVLAAYRYFGTYRGAVEAAGLGYDQIRIRPMPTWDKPRIVRRLRELKKEGEGLWNRAVRRNSPYLDRAARRCFGSYQRAAKAAGIESTSLQAPPYRFWSPQRIVQDLQALRRKGPASLKPANLMAHHPRLLQACRRRFGTYRAALQAAAIPYAEVARVTAPPLSSEQIIQRLRDLFERGKDMRYSKMAQNHPRLLNAARTRFGSYQAAMTAAKLSYPPTPPIRHWTAGLVLKTLRQLHRRDADLRYRVVKETRVPLFQAACHYFGSYLAAVRNAGIDYSRMVDAQLHRQLPARFAGAVNGASKRGN